VPRQSISYNGGLIVSSEAGQGGRPETHNLYYFRTAPVSPARSTSKGKQETGGEDAWFYGQKS
jgi:hypothetical protein